MRLTKSHLLRRFGNGEVSFVCDVSRYKLNPSGKATSQNLILSPRQDQGRIPGLSRVLYLSRGRTKNSGEKLTEQHPLLKDTSLLYMIIL
jgi:hypothetical protein